MLADQQLTAEEAARLLTPFAQEYAEDEVYFQVVVREPNGGLVVEEVSLPLATIEAMAGVSHPVGPPWGVMVGIPAAQLLAVQAAGYTGVIGDVSDLISRRRLTVTVVATYSH